MRTPDAIRAVVAGCVLVLGASCTQGAPPLDVPRSVTIHDADESFDLRGRTGPGATVDVAWADGYRTTADKRGRFVLTIGPFTEEATDPVPVTARIGHSRPTKRTITVTRTFSESYFKAHCDPTAYAALAEDPGSLVDRCFTAMATVAAPLGSSAVVATLGGPAERVVLDLAGVDQRRVGTRLQVWGRVRGGQVVDGATLPVLIVRFASDR